MGLIPQLPAMGTSTRSVTRKISVSMPGWCQRPIRTCVGFAGVYYTDIEREQIVAYGADTGQGFVRAPYVAPTGPNPTDLLFWDKFETSVFAAYGQVEFDLNDSMELAVALRYDREERDVDNQVPNVTNSGLNVKFAGRWW